MSAATHPDDNLEQAACAEALARIRAARASGQTYLDLGDINGLSRLPAEIGELTSLRVLALGAKTYKESNDEWDWADERFSMVRGLDDLTPLKDLPSLQQLDVSRTQVVDLTPLKDLPSLQQLDVSDTPVADLTPLKDLPSLQRLSVSSTEVADLTPLKDLPSLQQLDVGDTRVADLTPLKDLTSLQELFVGGTQVTDLTPLKDLSSLQELFVGGTQVTDLTPLKDLSSLQQLGVNSTPVADLTPLKDLTSLQGLYVGDTPVADLTPLKDLPSLQRLYVGDTPVADLMPLKDLSSLQELEVSHTLVADLTPIKDLSSLQHLDVSDISTLTSWEPLRGHSGLQALDTYGSGPATLTPDLLTSLSALDVLITNRIAGAPPEVLSENIYSDCLGSFHSWYADLQQGEARDQEVKVFVLGNGTAGKTQICRQLLGEGYDDQIPSTHGVQIGAFEILGDTGSRATRTKLWDFGGQDIYHGTHALFLEGRAVFLLVWSPGVEGKGDYKERGLSMHHHRLTYWLDYVRSLAGEDAALVVVQSKCDRESERMRAPVPDEPGFQRPLPQVTCSAKHGELGELKEAIRSSTRYLLEQHGLYRLPSSWVKVRDRLRELKGTEKTLSYGRFEEICQTTHGTSNPAALLNYLHRSGEVFYREGLFRNEIVLDQEWAVRAIYAVLDRSGPCQSLKRMGGIFTLPLLNDLVWRDAFTGKEQETILAMMESCAICFPLDQDRHSDPEVRRYALPDLLPLETEAKARVEALWRGDLPAQKVVLDYAFLNAGILREFLCQIGRLAGPDGAYWRYGCCFYDAATHSRARIHAELTPTPEAPARGHIVIETCEGQARELLARLQEAITKIRIGKPPQVINGPGGEPARMPEGEGKKPLEETLKIAPAPTERPLIYVSYAWGGEKEALVARLEARLGRAGYEVKRDKRAMRPGDWISDFMRELGRAKRVIVVISAKYVESSYCMRELLYLYHASLGEKREFLNRVVPLVLEDARISTTIQRLSHVRYWDGQLKELQDATKDLEPATWGGAGGEMTLIQDFRHHTELMLRCVSDYLMPRGITDIEKDDFAAVLEALKAKG